MVRPGADGALLQWLVSLIASLPFCSVGMQSAWFSPALENEEFKRLFNLTKEETSWVVSMPNIGSIFGSFLGGFLVDAIGRKWCIFATNLPGIVGWGLVYFGTTVPTLYAASFISGVAIGMSLNCVPIYIGEIASTELRGALGTLSNLMINVGVVYEYVCGPFVSVPFLAASSCVVPIVGAVGIIFVPETPEYLLAKDREKEAIASLERLRGQNPVETEMAYIKKDLKAKESAGSSVGALRKAGKAILIVSFLGFMQQVSGNAVLVSYFNEIYGVTTPPMSPIYANVIVSVLTVVTGLLSTWTVEKAGRRLLSHVSCGIQTVTYVALGLFYLYKDDENVKSMTWLPLVLISVILSAYNLGQGPLVFVLIGEILPKEMRATGATLSGLGVSLGAFVATYLYPLIEPHITFLSFGFLVFLTAVFYYVLVPETKGKEREEIRRLMKKGKTRVFTISDRVASA